mmetsp:Transcript_11852/g.24071  ORF Transcript_11852/g.24071 Transcript_11852/m.24071 type:complete len:303 (+) Transcript_11852:57-965(+)|eukprot:CAMPEP_0119094182 /NCGR_PEP_ID=MMETSP1178-20130426/165414_1 /TAXON_ID=33656 /ORGANISM="unid sp, Strain CCMP2000" /LENGTH=302 /DNA_ID=CAMNT_0007077897 /DNA_START=57 /DNA_END=965 /DNA_ORIENTATION=+
MANPTPTACPLLELSYDELSVLVHALCDPLRPQLAIQLSRAASGLRAAMKAQLIELRQQHEEAKQLASLYNGWSCADLRDAEQLLLGDFHGRPLSPAHWRTLGNLVARQCLRRLGTLVVIEEVDNGNGDEGMSLFSAGLQLGCLPSLTRLGVSSCALGPLGASALAAALSRRAVPVLQILRFGRSRIGDAGMVTLAGPLRRLPMLQRLWLFENGFGDEGLAALLAEPMTGALRSLVHLDFHNNQVGNAGCALLASALSRGVLPALEELRVDGNPASALSALRGTVTRSAVEEALSGRGAVVV